MPDLFSLPQGQFTGWFRMGKDCPWLYFCCGKTWEECRQELHKAPAGKDYTVAAPGCDPNDDTKSRYLSGA